MFGSSNVATAPGPATKLTPVGTPEATVVLNPLSVVAVVPSNVLPPSGKTNMCWVSVAPPVNTKAVE